MSGLKRKMQAIRKANKAADRCTCGHKHRMHKWPGGYQSKTQCKVALCPCKAYVEPTHED